MYERRPEGSVQSKCYVLSNKSVTKYRGRIIKTSAGYLWDQASNLGPEATPGILQSLQKSSGSVPETRPQPTHLHILFNLLFTNIHIRIRNTEWAVESIVKTAVVNIINELIAFLHFVFCVLDLAGWSLWVGSRVFLAVRAGFLNIFRWVLAWRG